MQGRRVWAAWYGAGGRAVACGDKGTRGLLWSGQTSGVFKDTHPRALPPPPTVSIGGGRQPQLGGGLGACRRFTCPGFLLSGVQGSLGREGPTPAPTLASRELLRFGLWGRGSDFH